MLNPARTVASDQQDQVRRGDSESKHHDLIERGARPVSCGNLQCQPVTNSITVDLRETPTRYVWDFGDNRTAQDGHPASFTTSTGLGRAYTDPYTASSVQHKYVQSSLKFFDAGGFPISLRITWAAAFRVNGGSWQGLDPVTGTFESRHQVRESWPVGVNNATAIRPAP